MAIKVVIIGATLASAEELEDIVVATIGNNSEIELVTIGNFKGFQDADLYVCLINRRQEVENVFGVEKVVALELLPPPEYFIKISHIPENSSVIVFNNTTAGTTTLMECLKRYNLMHVNYEVVPYDEWSEDQIIQKLSTAKYIIGGIMHVGEDCPLYARFRAHIPQDVTIIASPLRVATSESISRLSRMYSALYHDQKMREEKENEEALRKERDALKLLIAQIQQANLQLKALARVSQSLNAALALPDALKSIAESSRAVLGAGRCAIYLLDTATCELHCVLAQGLSPSYTDLVIKTYPEIPAANVMETRQPVVIRDAANDPCLTAMRAAIRKEGFHSVALLPLAFGDEGLGMLAFYYETEREYSGSDLELAQTFANQAAIAIKNAQLLDSIREVAALEERNRLAREIHDTLAQGLTGIVVQLEAAERVAVKQPERAVASLDRAKKLARHCLEEARRSLWNLRPTPLESLSLFQALSQEVASINEREGLRVDLSLCGEERRLAPAVELNLFRIAQEALTNVERHAQASTATVLLNFDNASVSLVVSDDGIGLSNASDTGKQNGMGLIGMRERAHMLGGDLHIESQHGKGTRITLRAFDEGSGIWR